MENHGEGLPECYKKCMRSEDGKSEMHMGKVCHETPVIPAKSTKKKQTELTHPTGHARTDLWDQMGHLRLVERAPSFLLRERGEWLPEQAVTQGRIRLVEGDLWG